MVRGLLKRSTTWWQYGLSGVGEGSGSNVYRELTGQKRIGDGQRHPRPEVDRHIEPNRKHHFYSTEVRTRQLC